MILLVIFMFLMAILLAFWLTELIKAISERSVLGIFITIFCSVISCTALVVNMIALIKMMHE